MKNSFRLSIPKPCHENWEAFTPTPSGGFCASCQKNVRDFTQMSDTELIAFFRDASSKKNSSLCGRFRDNQLQKNFDTNQWFPEWIVEENQLFCEISIEKLQEKNLKIQLPSIYKSSFLRNSIAAMLFLSVTVNAQNRIISGKVTDAENGEGLPGVSIQIIGTNKGTTSNEKGEYSLEVDENQKLRFGFIGYKTEEIEAKKAQNVNLQMELEVLGEVAVYAYSQTMGKMMTGGIVSTVCSTESFTSKETLLPQPNKLSIYPNIAQDTEVFLKPEAIESKNGIEKTAFGEIENLEVYEYYSGKSFKIDYKKEENGEIKLNISKITNGLYVVRLVQKNETEPEKPIVSIARLVVER